MSLLCIRPSRLFNFASCSACQSRPEEMPRRRVENVVKSYVRRGESQRGQEYDDNQRTNHTLGHPKFRYDDALESDLATPAGEITSRHRVDRRSLLPLAARRDAVATKATSRIAPRNRRWSVKLDVTQALQQRRLHLALPACRRVSSPRISDLPLLFRPRSPSRDVRCRLGRWWSRRFGHHR
jgi:hypothetical protein